MLRLAAQTALLEAEALTEMSGGFAEQPRIALAVNAIRWRHGSPGCSPGWATCSSSAHRGSGPFCTSLREGVVMGAVTTERTPVGGAGCIRSG